MKPETLTLAEVDELIRLLGGVEVVRMILKRTSGKPSLNGEISLPAANRDPTPIPKVLEYCGTRADGAAPEFIVRSALQRLQESLEAGQTEVFLKRSFFEQRFKEENPGFCLGTLRNTFTPRQGVGLRELCRKIAEFGYEMEIESKGVVVKRSDWNTLK